MGGFGLRLAGFVRGAPVRQIRRPLAGVPDSVRPGWLERGRRPGEGWLCGFFLEWR